MGIVSNSQRQRTPNFLDKCKGKRGKEVELPPFLEDIEWRVWKFHEHPPGAFCPRPSFSVQSREVRSIRGREEAMIII